MAVRWSVAAGCNREGPTDLTKAVIAEPTEPFGEQCDGNDFRSIKVQHTGPRDRIDLRVECNFAR